MTRNGKMRTFVQAKITLTCVTLQPPNLQNTFHKNKTKNVKGKPSTGEKPLLCAIKLQHPSLQNMLDRKRSVIVIAGREIRTAVHRIQVTIFSLSQVEAVAHQNGPSITNNRLGRMSAQQVVRKQNNTWQEHKCTFRKLKGP